MSFASHLKKTGFLSAIGLFLCSAAYAISPHLERPKQTPEIVVRYNIVDMGETHLDTETLSKQTLSQSLSPAINDSGLVMGNDNEGGFIKDLHSQRYTPVLRKTVISFHDINNYGDILVSWDRGSGFRDWLIWSLDRNRNKHQLIHFGVMDSNRVEISKLNDHWRLAGFVNPAAPDIKADTKLLPIMWTPLEGVHRPGFRLDIYGLFRGVNNRGTAYGYADQGPHQPPFVWSDDQGIKLLDNWTSKVKLEGWPNFGNLVITDDDTVYGTYWFGENDIDKGNPLKRKHYGFVWRPYQGGLFDLLDLDGMQISGVNGYHQLVGSVNGQAVLRDPGRKPVELITLLPAEKAKGWELIEATNVNNAGEIVGFGKYNGKMHIFGLEPVER